MKRKAPNRDSGALSSALEGWPDDLREKSEYMFELLQGLVHVARNHPREMRDLIYFLEMAALEADRGRRRGRRTDP